MASPAPAPYFRIYALSERAVTVEFGQHINEGTLNQIRNFDIALQQNPFPGFSSTVPAYTTLTVYYDPLALSCSGLPGADGFAKVSAHLQGIHAQQKSTATTPGDTITIPVCYGAELGPDIEDVARHNQLTVNEVINLHNAAIYTVYMIGFVPGFAYLGGMDARLATPRKVSPRKAVPAGAVGIAGEQTGVYPMQTPGGWQLIGQTTVKLFDANRLQPSLLKAGDKVKFQPISPEEFNLSTGK
jgi:inhibitor of KinA